MRTSGGRGETGGSERVSKASPAWAASSLNAGSTAARRAGSASGEAYRITRAGRAVEVGVGGRVGLACGGWVRAGAGVSPAGGWGSLALQAESSRPEKSSRQSRRGSGLLRRARGRYKKSSNRWTGYLECYDYIASLFYPKNGCPASPTLPGCRRRVVSRNSIRNNSCRAPGGGKPDSGNYRVERGGRQEGAANPLFWGWAQGDETIFKRYCPLCSLRGQQFI